MVWMVRGRVMALPRDEMAAVFETAGGAVVLLAMVGATSRR